MQPTTAGYYWYNHFGVWTIVEVEKGHRGLLWASLFSQETPTWVEGMAEANWGPKLEPPKGEREDTITLQLVDIRKIIFEGKVCPECGMLLKILFYENSKRLLLHCLTCGSYWDCEVVVIPND